MVWSFGKAIEVHNKKIIDKYLNELDTIFSKIKTYSENGNIDQFLNSPICSSGFDRLN